MNSLFKLVGQSKVYMARATSWIGFINLFLLIANFKLLYGIPIPLWLVLALGSIIMSVGAYLDYRFVYPYEIAYVNAQNDIKHQLDRNEKQVNRIEDQINEIYQKIR